MHWETDNRADGRSRNTDNEEVGEVDQWTQLRLENLIGGAKAAQVGLGSGFVRFGLWAMGENRRIDDAMSKDQVAVLER